jgi:hypothetical protein
MKYWEIEFECDDSWSISGTYAFYLRQETVPTAEDIKNVHHVYPNYDGLGNISRIDFFMTPDGEIYFNEINSIPGMTKTSLYPEITELYGRLNGALFEALANGAPIL